MKRKRKTGERITEHTDAMLRRRDLSTLLATHGTTHYTLEELAQMLARKGHTNKNGDPYHFTTISEDVKQLKAIWRQYSVANIADHKAEQLARLENLYTHAMNRKTRDLFGIEHDNPDYREARLILDSRAKLLGLNEPETIILVQTHEAMHQIMTSAWIELTEEFKDDPATLNKITAALKRSDVDETQREPPQLSNTTN